MPLREGLAIHRIQAEEGLNSSRLALITAGITLEDGSRRSCIAFSRENRAPARWLYRDGIARLRHVRAISPA